MKVGIIGLGMIGGSLARAYQSSNEAEVYGYDIEPEEKELAMMSGVLNGFLTKDILSECNLLLFALPPKMTVTFIRKYALFFGSKPILVDCAPTKRMVCECVFPLAEKYDFNFLGGHPMTDAAGSGFRYSRSDLFRGIPMVLVPPHSDDEILLDRVKRMLAPAGFGAFPVITAEDHDRMIAYSSQLTQILSSAYAQNRTIVLNSENRSALSRTAPQDPAALTELFLENSDFLLEEIDTMIRTLSIYRRTLSDGDETMLRALLNAGKTKKEEADYANGNNPGFEYL